jgi:hypothetical protein
MLSEVTPGLQQLNREAHPRLQRRAGRLQVAFSAATTIEAACASDQTSATGVVQSVLALVHYPKAFFSLSALADLPRIACARAELDYDSALRLREGFAGQKAKPERTSCRDQTEAVQMIGFRFRNANDLAQFFHDSAFVGLSPSKQLD